MTTGELIKALQAAAPNSEVEIITEQGAFSVREAGASGFHGGGTFLIVAEDTTPRR